MNAFTIFRAEWLTTQKITSAGIKEQRALVQEWLNLSQERKFYFMKRAHRERANFIDNQLLLHKLQSLTDKHLVH